MGGFFPTVRPTREGETAPDEPRRLPTLRPLGHAVADCRRHAGRTHRRQNAIRTRAGAPEWLVGVERTAVYRDHRRRLGPGRPVLPGAARGAGGRDGGGGARPARPDVVRAARAGPFPGGVGDVAALAEHRALPGGSRPPSRRSRDRSARGRARRAAGRAQPARFRKDPRGHAPQRVSGRAGRGRGRPRRMELHVLPVRQPLARRALGLAAVRPPSEPQLLRPRGSDGAHPMLHGGRAGPCRCRAARRPRPVRGRGAQGARADALAFAGDARQRPRLAFDERRGPPSGPLALRRPSSSGRRASGQPDRALRGPDLRPAPGPSETRPARSRRVLCRAAPAGSPKGEDRRGRTASRR